MLVLLRRRGDCLAELRQDGGWKLKNQHAHTRVQNPALPKAVVSRSSALTTAHPLSFGAQKVVQRALRRSKPQPRDT